MAASQDGYQPPPDYKEDKKELLAEISVTDSTELWLMQWPLNQLQPDEFEGKELSLKLHHDGTLGTFESSSGKSYDLVSFAAHKPDATVILASASESKVVGKFTRRVCLVHYPEPESIDERSVRSSQGLSGSLRGNSDQFATPVRSLTKSSRSTSSRMHSSEQKSSVISKTSSIRGEPSQHTKRKRVASPTPSEETMRSMDRSTRDSGRAGHSSVSSLGYSEDDNSQGRKSKKKKHKAGE
eukprot:TRINITY_DN2422_c0_g1_i1.p1 TRINITY_DN2422_c0_g1~~TRINITY_DN2422_c0_g1_i1.p1  ORF type:complete len:240 (-),score=41.95 TRINITY_DN2422_c0_g1_i1:369-1088(-)